MEHKNKPENMPIKKIKKSSGSFFDVNCRYLFIFVKKIFVIII